MSKTPRTLIEGFLDASKTQTVKVDRNRYAGFVRTPELPAADSRRLVPRLSRTPQPVAHSVNDVITNEGRRSRTPDARLLTPRSAGRTRSGDRLMGRMSRTPDVHMLSATRSRPQHDRVSSLRSKRRSFSGLEELETPRQIFEGVLEEQNTTAPLVRYTSRTLHGRVSNSQPAKHLSSSRGDNLTMELESDSPRTLFQQFLLGASDVVQTPVSTHHSTRSPEIPKSQSYHTPSPFRDSPTKSDGALETTRNRRTPRSARRGHGTFNLSGVVAETLYQANGESLVIPPTNPDAYQTPSPFRTSSSSDEESFVPKSQPDRPYLNRTRAGMITIPSSLQEEIREDIQRLQSQKEDRENIVSLNQRRSHSYAEDRAYNEDHRYAGDRTNTVDNMNAYDRASYDEQNEQKNEDSLDDYPDNDEVREMEPEEGVDMDRPVVQLLPPGNKYMLPLKDVDDENDSGEPTGERSVDGHVSGSSRYSISSVDISPVISEKSDHNSSLHREQVRDERDLKRIGRWSEGHLSRVGTSGGGERLEHLSLRSRSFSGAAVATVEDHHKEMFFAQRLQHSQADNLYRLPNLSGNFSPKITSTQKNAMEVNQDDADGIPSVTPPPNVSPTTSPVPWSRSASPQRSRSRVLTPSQKENLSPLQRTNQPSRISPLPNTSHTVELMQSRSGTPGSVSPRSRSGTSSVGKSAGKWSMSPLQTVTPSPVVSSGVNSLSQSPRFVDLQLSKRRSHTPIQTIIPQRSPHKSLASSVQRSGRRKSRSDLSVSKVGDNTEPIPSPVLAGRKRVRDVADTLPNNTANFSPPVASTQNIAAILNAPPESDRDMEDAENAVQDIDRVSGPESGNEMDVDNAPAADQLAQKIDIAVQKCVRKPRKPRQKSSYSLPVNVVKKPFTLYAGLRASKEAIEEVMKTSEIYWDNLAKDLEAYAKHAGRKRISMDDFELLFRRQGLVNNRVSLKSLIEKYLPMEEREKLIPVARAGNRLEPKV